ncbi:unnamed protein product (macronuclear) [Paramecium tetraurelia]|uniref:Uncharacterized protein n=1 Tax=Paramecium tetraurelia TaxID=5888 RepID=A0CTE5_PARTE|nr:uncharacterized protein GSPATT00010296001 [Paramecium tetraurelia]CAK74062.1 unnamed protein product [Paramecium tetraurelia]|eukprot:XP_001441459.1 hypothetical protein (macronuclear) [Paramecium tetraurelia strain d4-2]
MSDLSQFCFNCNNNTEDLLVSQFSEESQFKFQESLQQRIKRQNQQSQVENRNTYLIQEQHQAYLPSSVDCKEIQLLKLVSHLRQLLQKQQQDFSEKELSLQQKLLTLQQKHDKMISLMKTKYQIIIEEQQSQISLSLIENTNLKQQIFQFQEQLHQSATLRIKQVSELERNKNQNCFSTQNNQNSKLNDWNQPERNQDQLLQLYKQEIDKLKQQTTEFDRKFENERQCIKQEISTLKNQNLMIQTLISQKYGTNSSAQKSYALNSDKKINNNQPRSYSHNSRKTQNF